MIEPEVAFADLASNMKLAEDCLKSILRYVLASCDEDLEFLENRRFKLRNSCRRTNATMRRCALGCRQLWIRHSSTSPTPRPLTCFSVPSRTKKKFKYPVEWGVDLQSEHERWLVEKHFNGPVIITDYPASIKAFYMRQNDDGKTVAAMDVLVPGIGEIIGGSQREERLDRLQAKCAEFNIPEDHVWWYLDTRRFGSAVHSGFGMGFERLVMYVTGMTNIRDVIPFPRTPQNAEF